MPERGGDLRVGGALRLVMLHALWFSGVSILCFLRFGKEKGDAGAETYFGLRRQEDLHTF